MALYVSDCFWAENVNSRATLPVSESAPQEQRVAPHPDQSREGC